MNGRTDGVSPTRGILSSPPQRLSAPRQPVSGEQIRSGGDATGEDESFRERVTEVLDRFGFEWSLVLLVESSITILQQTLQN